MFNPKITKGKWVLEDCIVYDKSKKILIADLMETHVDNARAIASVPELLEVYKSAKELQHSINHQKFLGRLYCHYRYNPMQWESDKEYELL